MATKKKAVKKFARKKPLKPTTKRKPPILELFLQALAELYPTDALVPGLSMAYLPCDRHKALPEHMVDKAGGSYYVSVFRYDGAMPANPADHNAKNYKHVLYKAYGPTAVWAVRDIINQWLHATKAVQALRSGKEL